MISKNFIKTSFIYTVAGALPMASAIILLPFYIQYLPTEVYGALSLYLAFSMFVQILVTYSFDSSVYVHYHDYKNDQAKLSSFMSSVFVLMLLLGAAVGLLLALIGNIAFELIFNDPRISFFPFGFMSVAVGITQAITKVYNSILQSSEKVMAYLLNNLVQFFLIAALTIIGLDIFPETLVGPIGARLIAGAVIVVWVMYRVFNEFGFHFNFSLLRSTFSFNHFTFIHQIQQWVIGYFDRFLMLFFLPLSVIGVYDFAIKCLVVIEYLINSLQNTFNPKVVSTITAQTTKGSTPELNRYFNGLTGATMIMVSGAIVVLPLVLYLFKTDKGYHDAIQYLPYLAVLYLLRPMRSYFAIPYGVLKYTKPLPVISFFIAVLKIGLMIALIQRFEIYGIIASTILSLSIEVWVLKYVLSKRFVFSFNVFKLIVAPALLIVMVILLEPMTSKVSELGVHIFYAVVTGAFLLWVYRNELKLLRMPK